MKNRNQLLMGAVDAALEAGQAVLDVYQSDFAVESKEDKSPLTLADKRSHEIIQSRLADFGIPMISEEGKHTPYDIRSSWSTAWMVDPLDGTKEFVKRNGEFTVNIALIENQYPVLGVIFAPVQKWLYFASVETGAFKLDLNTVAEESLDDTKTEEERLQDLMSLGAKLPIEQQREPYTIVGSRSHATPELESFVAQQKKERGDVVFIAAGSSLKICMVAEGSADVYPRMGPTMEWDTAAGQAVAECAGAAMSVLGTDERLRYNREDMLNPWFLVER